jgi:hypothetical protein
MGGHSEYFIGTNADTVKNLNDENSIAKLRGINITSTEYILYDYQHTHSNKQQSAAIIYVSYYWRITISNIRIAFTAIFFEYMLKCP